MGGYMGDTWADTFLLHGDNGLLRMRKRPVGADVSSRYIPWTVYGVYTLPTASVWTTMQPLNETMQLKRKDTFYGRLDVASVQGVANVRASVLRGTVLGIRGSLHFCPCIK